VDVETVRWAGASRVEAGARGAGQGLGGRARISRRMRAGEAAAGEQDLQSVRCGGQRSGGCRAGAVYNPALIVSTDIYSSNIFILRGHDTSLYINYNHCIKLCPNFFIYINKGVLSNYKFICNLHLFLTPGPRSVSPRPSRVVGSE
jgi:hypothetical protein